MSPVELDILTWNIYLGGDHTGLPDQPGRLPLPEAVARLWKQVRATNFPSRARAIAEVIVEHAPDVVALQEVFRWRVDARRIAGTEIPMAVPVYDFLATLLGELSARGLPYVVAARAPGLDLRLVAQGGLEVGLADGQAILVRADTGLGFDGPRGGSFRAALHISVDGQPVPLIRQWTSIDLRASGRVVRIVNTHLESADATRTEQCRELLAGPAARRGRPVLLVGDFNADPDSPTWRDLHEAGFADAWCDRGAGPGPTYREDHDLADPCAPLQQRIDWVLHSGGIEARMARVVGGDRTDRTRDARPLWPSDHAAVLVRVVLPPVEG